MYVITFASLDLTNCLQMKIKNRSPSDHTVEILAPAQTGPFRYTHYALCIVHYTTAWPFTQG